MPDVAGIEKEGSFEELHSADAVTVVTIGILLAFLDSRLIDGWMGDPSSAFLPNTSAMEVWDLSVRR